MSNNLAAWSPRILSILRIITGFLFLWHGTQKLFNFPTKEGFTAATGIVLVAGILEFFGGVMFMLGILTRPVAFLLSGLMAAAYFMAHGTLEMSQQFLPIVNKGELAVLYCFVFLYFVFAGGGAWSMDKAIWKRS